MNEHGKKKSFLTEILEAFKRGYDKQDKVIKEQLSAKACQNSIIYNSEGKYCRTEKTRRALKQSSNSQIGT